MADRRRRQRRPGPAPQRERTAPRGPEGPEPGTPLELEVTGIAHGGVAVARHEGRVVFVADALPGERVVAEVRDTTHRSFWRADAVRVLDASPDRVPHVWAEASIERPPAERAGGAEFGHATPAAQRRLKTEVLTDALRRFAGLEAGDGINPEVLAVPRHEGEADTGLRWRTRVALQVDTDGRIGPFAARSRTVVPTATLPLATAGIERAARLDSPRPGEEQLRLVHPADGYVVEPRAGRTIVERAVGRDFRLAADGFWQVHPRAADVLAATVADLVDDDLLDAGAANLDLYGGVGLFARVLTDRLGTGARITTVESDDTASGFAAENLADVLGVRAVPARVDRYLREEDRTATPEGRRRAAGATVLLDPPRTGAGREVVEAIAASRPAQVVYVACDPVALARDLGTFSGLGYRTQRLRAHDLFPHTHHLEAVAVLTRAPA